MRLGATLAFVVALASSSTRADWTRVDERWYALSLAGTECGYSVARVDRDGDRIRSSESSVLALDRAGTRVSVEMSSEFVETERGEPVRGEVRQKLGGAATVTVYEFARSRGGADESGGWTVTARSGASVNTAELPRDGWLAPFAAETFVRERLAAGVKRIEYATVDLGSGARVTHVEMLRTSEGVATVDADGASREIPVTEWKVTSDLLPVPSVERLARDGVTVESVATLGIGELRSRLTNERRAKDAANGRSAEVLVRAFVPASAPIRGARDLLRLRVRVSTKEGTLPDLPSAGAQRARREAPEVAIVEIDAGRGSPAAESDASDPRYLASTALIDFESDAVADLRTRALAGKLDAGARERAEILRHAVSRWIRRKDLSSAFARASEAARSRSGDCSEHAVLLAALLRADGIPARIASGLVYADQFAGARDVWGWHVWTQACLPAEGDRDGAAAREWVDLDASLPSRFDAAHICTGVGDLAGGATDPMWLGALSLIGNLAVETLPADEPSHREHEAIAP